MTQPQANPLPPTGHPAPTRRGVHSRLMQLSAVHDNGFRPELISNAKAMITGRASRTSAVS